MKGNQEVTCLILAGGAGTRLGGRDKGLMLWRNNPLISHVAKRIRCQTKNLLVSCNRNSATYEKMGFQTVADCRAGYQGPLAGIEAARSHLDTPYLAVVACDMPLIPHDLIERLLRPFECSEQPAPSVTFANDGTNDQYLCAIIHRDCLSDISTYLRGGERAVKHWYGRHQSLTVDFSDQAGGFLNFNQLENFSTQ